VAARYRQGFAAAGLGDAVRLPPGDGDAHPVYHLYNIRADRRDQLREHCTRAGIGTAVYYTLPLHRQPCWASLGYRDGDFPVAERASAEILALPCWPGLPEADQARVIDAIRGFYRGR
jgi:dTDP-4-amino-4,6-dideoxygalactose transaminase